MINENEKTKTNQAHLQRQSRLLTESLKLLLGQGLTHSQPLSSERKQRALFLKEVLKTEMLIQ